jgi:hypothetical protein
VGIDIGKYKKFNFWKQGHKSITILVYRNILFLYQDQLFDFQKKSVDVITVFARHEVLLLVLLKILLFCDVMPY